MINLPTKENYEKFRKNPKIDPETGKRLTIGKAPYLRYLRLCDEYEKIMNSIVSTPVLGLCPRDPSGAGGAAQSANTSSLTIKTIDPILNNEVLVFELILAIDFYDLISLYFVCRKFNNLLRTKIILKKLGEKFEKQYRFEDGHLYFHSFWGFISSGLWILTFNTFERQLLYSTNYIVSSWYYNSNNLLQCRFGNYKRDQGLLTSKNFLYSNGFKKWISIINIKFDKTPYNHGKFSPEDQKFYEGWLCDFLFEVITHVISLRGFFHPPRT